MTPWPFRYITPADVAAFERMRAVLRAEAGIDAPLGREHVADWTKERALVLSDRVLAAVAELTPAGGIGPTASTVARHLGVARQNVADAVRGLVARGVLERRPMAEKFGGLAAMELRAVSS